MPSMRSLYNWEKRHRIFEQVARAVWQEQRDAKLIVESLSQNDRGRLMTACCLYGHRLTQKEQVEQLVDYFNKKG